MRSLLLSRLHLCKLMLAAVVASHLNGFVGSYAVVGLVVVGGTWYLGRLARGPTGAYKHSPYS